MSLSISLPFLLTLLGLPFLAFACLWAGGSRLNKAAGWLAIGTTLVGLIASILPSKPTVAQEFIFEWIQLDGFSLHLTFRLDSLTSLMLPLVHFIALLVQVYSTAYMKGDKGLYRYFAFLQLFLFSMLGIILAGDLIVMYIFWELVGLASYLLIGFWYHKPRAVWAAKKAFILNRIGDAAFLAGILILLFQVGSTRFTSLQSLISALSSADLTLISLLLFGGCVGKSAQFPLSGWLPDAMEGPTPVSALIHAATMVAAGIFLLARIAFLFTPSAEIIIAIVGIITLLDGSIKACRTWDIKRVLAYSTISQLGLMVFAVGVGSWQIAIFHLLTHAFFKAGLFLSAGSVIHAITPSESNGFDPQDMRNMGGLGKKMPITFVCYLVCATALSGLPFFSGFLSKDAIFVHALDQAGQYGSGLLYTLTILAIGAAGLTAYYMTRQVRLIFFGQERYLQTDTGSHPVHPHESPFTMWAPMAILATLSIFLWFSWNPLDGGSGWLLNTWLPFELSHNLWVPLISLAVTLAGIGFGFRLKLPTVYTHFETDRDKFERFRWQKDFQLHHNHHIFFMAPFQLTAKIFQHVETNIIDYTVNALSRIVVIFSHAIGWIDRILVDGLVKFGVWNVRSSGLIVRRFQNGKIQSYFIFTAISLLLIVVWLLLLV